MEVNQMHSKLAKRVLGAMISAAVMVSMIPAMAFAADTRINARPSQTINAPGNRTTNGINIAVAGDESNIGASWGIGVGYTEGGTYTFTIPADSPYNGYVISKIEFTSTTVSHSVKAEDCDEGWSDLESGTNFTWTGTPSTKVELHLLATGESGDEHTVRYSNLYVYVQIPVDGITLSADSDYMYVGDANYQIAASLSPDNTTFTANDLTWEATPETVATLNDSHQLTAVGPGTVTVAASACGVSGSIDVTVYEHVAGAAITAPEGPFYVGYNYDLTVAPTNPAANLHEGDWEVTSWSSDDTDIATVNKADDGSGQVVALAATEEGEPVVITAVITDTVTQETWNATFEMNISEVPATTMFRLFYEDTGEHLFTTNAGERDYLKNHGWNYEGGAWLTPTTSNTPVYRLFNPNNGEHFYSSNLGEIEGLVAIGWRNEDIAFYADDFRTVAVYRLFNPAAQSNTHIYSTDAGEISYLVAHGWLNEGPAFYASGLMNAS